MRELNLSTPRPALIAIVIDNALLSPCRQLDKLPVSASWRRYLLYLRRFPRPFQRAVASRDAPLYMPNRN